MIRVTNGVEDFYLTSTKYSNGELLCRYGLCDKIELCQDVEIIWQFENDNELDCLEELVKRLKLKMKGLGELFLTILHMPYVSSITNITYQSYQKGVKLHKLIERVNAMQFDEVRVVDPKSLTSIFGLERLKLYKLGTLVEDCERAVGTKYDAVCFMSQDKMLKYENLGVNVPNPLCYVESRNFKGKIYGRTSKGLEGARVLIIDDTCYKGSSYGRVIKMLKNYLGAADVDLYVTQLAEESFAVDGLITTDVSNVITMTGRHDTATDEMNDATGRTIPVYELKLDKWVMVLDLNLGV